MVSLGRFGVFALVEGGMLDILRCSFFCFCGDLHGVPGEGDGLESALDVSLFGAQVGEVHLNWFY